MPKATGCQRQSYIMKKRARSGWAAWESITVTGVRGITWKPTPGQYESDIHSDEDGKYEDNSHDNNHNHKDNHVGDDGNSHSVRSPVTDQGIVRADHIEEGREGSMVKSQHDSAIDVEQYKSNVGSISSALLKRKKLNVRDEHDEALDGRPSGKRQRRKASA